MSDVYLQIEEFGQVPRQIFKSSHPSRLPLEQVYAYYSYLHFGSLVLPHED